MNYFDTVAGQNTLEGILYQMNRLVLAMEEQNKLLSEQNALLRKQLSSDEVSAPADENSASGNTLSLELNLL